jgi:hypothetical protein
MWPAIAKNSTFCANASNLGLHTASAGVRDSVRSHARTARCRFGECASASSLLRPVRIVSAAVGRLYVLSVGQPPLNSIRE